MGFLFALFRSFSFLTSIDNNNAKQIINLFKKRTQHNSRYIYIYIYIYSERKKERKKEIYRKRRSRDDGDIFFALRSDCVFVFVSVSDGLLSIESTTRQIGALVEKRCK